MKKQTSPRSFFPTCRLLSGLIVSFVCFHSTGMWFCCQVIPDWGVKYLMKPPFRLRLWVNMHWDLDYRRIRYRETTRLVAQAELMQQLRAALEKTNIQLQAEQRREETQLHNDDLHKLFWEFLAISRRRPVCVWHAKKMAAVFHRPIKTQTCYVMVFTAADAAQRVSFCLVIWPVMCLLSFDLKCNSRISGF